MLLEQELLVFILVHVKMLISAIVMVIIFIEKLHITVINIHNTKMLIFIFKCMCGCFQWKMKKRPPSRGEG